MSQGPYMPQGDQPGKNAALGGLVCGILSVVLGGFLGTLIVTPIIGLVLGIVGLVMSSNAKKQGFNGGLNTAGLVLSIIGVVYSAITFISCTICAGCLGAAGACSSFLK